jgi:hypothetical protein
MSNAMRMDDYGNRRVVLEAEYKAGRQWTVRGDDPRQVLKVEEDENDEGEPELELRQCRYDLLREQEFRITHENNNVDEDKVANRFFITHVATGVNVTIGRAPWERNRKRKPGVDFIYLDPVFEKDETSFEGSSVFFLHSVRSQRSSIRTYGTSRSRGSIEKVFDEWWFWGNNGVFYSAVGTVYQC